MYYFGIFNSGWIQPNFKLFLKEYQNFSNRDLFLVDKFQFQQIYVFFMCILVSVPFPNANPA